MDLSVGVILLLLHRASCLILLEPPDLRVDDLQKALFPTEAETGVEDILAEFSDLAKLDAELGRPGEWSPPKGQTAPSRPSHVTSLEASDFLWPESSVDDEDDDTEEQLEKDIYSASKMLTSHRRQRRSVGGRIDAKVEVLVVVDNSVYRWYMVKSRNKPRVALARIRRYFAIVFAMVDQRYQTIPDRNLNIGVKISGILVAESRQDAAWLEYQVKWTGERGSPGSVNANRALAKLQRWLSSQTSLPKHDHAMAFTRYSLVNKFHIELGGLAYVSSVCLDDEQSISIVADAGDYQSVKVATHELGHSLGASHDGDEKNQKCPPNDNYIMAPQNSNVHHKLKNAFYFSDCSIQQMKMTLGSPNGACVLDTPSVFYQYNLERRPPGKIYSANLQCKMVFGKKSGICRKQKLRKMMCSQLWCKDPVNGYTCRTSSYLTALPGSRCGRGKSCHLGECRREPYSRGRAGHGRRAVARAGRRGRRRRNRKQRQPVKPCAADRNSQYCEGLIRLNPRACQRSAVGTYCCRTCARIRR